VYDSDNIHHYMVDNKSQNNYRRALGRAHVPPTKVFPRLAMNKTILKQRLAAAMGPNTYTWDFPSVIKFRVAEKQFGSGIRTIIRTTLKVNQFVHVPTPVDNAKFHPNPCTRFWVISLTDRQTKTDKLSRAIAFTSSLSEVINGCARGIASVFWFWFYCFSFNFSSVLVYIFSFCTAMFFLFLCCHLA